ncbi:MAG: hypothetical protein PHU81_09750 [Acidobacteriota bacterium]|nr:hypothetical protein [Acidobacteriota bacterium]
MKKSIYLILIIGLTLSVRTTLTGQSPRVESMHNLFSDDMGEREDIFFEALKAAGGVFENPSWSPEGAMVAFDFGYLHPRSEEENSLLCILDIASKSLKIISILDDFCPTWSPDSSQIAFTSDRSGRSLIYKINIDRTNLIQLTTSESWGPAWSPDGGRIAYDTEDGIWIMNNDGTGVTQVTFVPSDCQVTWSPDSQRIAFASKRNGKLNIWVMNADGSNPVQLTQKGGAVPAWSPDGKWIAFNRGRQIWLVSPDGQKEVHLRTDFPVGVPSWSPDGRKIVFDGVKDFEYDADLYVMTIKY